MTKHPMARHPSDFASLSCMKRNVSLCIILMLSTASANSYINKSRGFSCNLPNGWINNITPGVEAAFISDKSIRNFIPNITIAIEIIPHDMTLQVYSKLTQKKLKRFIRRSSITDIINTKINGYPAQKIISKGHQNGYNLKYITAITIKEQKAYAITGTTLQRGDRHFDTLFDKTISSFRFTY